MTSALTSATSGRANVPLELIGGGVVSVTLLALLVFASRPSTKAYFRAAAAVGKTSESVLAPSPKVPDSQDTGPIFLNEFVLQSTTVAPTVDERAVPGLTASTFGASSDTASPKTLSATKASAWAGKGVGLDEATPARLSAVAAALKWLAYAEVAA